MSNKLKNRVLDYVNEADSHLLKLMEALALNYEKEKTGLPTAAQKEELDRRLKRFDEGKTEFYTWYELEKKLKKIP